jgi:hypothetical protein
LRDNEAALKAGNSSLKDALARNGLPVPDEGDPPNRIAGVSAPSDLNLLFTPSSLAPGEMSSAGSVTIDLTELSVIEPEKWCSVTAAMDVPIPFEVPTIVPAQPSSHGHISPSHTLREGSVGNYGLAPALSPQAAIDFVLEYDFRNAFHLALLMIIQT